MMIRPSCLIVIVCTLASQSYALVQPSIGRAAQRLSNGDTTRVDQPITDDVRPSVSLSKINNDPMARTTPLLAGDDSEDLENSNNINAENSRRAFLGSLASVSAVALVTTSPSKVEAASLATAAPPVDWSAIFSKASKRALGGGKAGAAAAVVQVCSLMWLRTSMNYQYRYGGNLQSSLSTLWEEGGVARLYQGLPFALIQGPLTRFGDTAANVGIFALLEALPETQGLPLPIKTACGSVAAGLWRIVLMPVDSSKTILQVEGNEGLEKLWGSVAEQGPGPLYRGALAQAAATAAGHFPWFLTFNFLNEKLPIVASDDLLLTLARSALLGLTASCTSDCVSNSLRVVKTTRQTAQVGEDGKELSYLEIVNSIVEQDGVAGLLGRGLQTRLLTNMIQGAAFSVLWKYFQQVGA